MATVLDLIQRSLRLAQAIDPGEDLSSAEAQDGLSALNSMLDSWSLDRLYVYAIKEDQVTWPAGEQSRTVGTGGDFAITWPSVIEESTFFRTANNDDYPLTLMSDRQSYSAIIDKDTQTDLPSWLYYEPEYPLGKLFIWPVPSPAITLFLHSWTELTQYAAITDVVSLPRGYKEMIEFGLAEVLAPEFGVTVPQGVTKRAASSKKAVRKINRPRHVSQAEPSLLARRGNYNIYADRH